MKKSKFAAALQAELEEKSITPAHIEREANKRGEKVSRQYLSKLLNDTPHNITEAPPRPSREKVQVIAEIIGWDEGEAMFAAGYAPQSLSDSDVDDTLMDVVYSKFKKAGSVKREELRKILEMVDAELDKEVK